MLKLLNKEIQEIDLLKERLVKAALYDEFDGIFGESETLAKISDDLKVIRTALQQKYAESI